MPLAFESLRRTEDVMLADDANVQRHKTAVERLLRTVGDPEEFPWFVSDDATILDVSSMSEGDLLERITTGYGQALSAEDLRRPLWQLAVRLDSPNDAVR